MFVMLFILFVIFIHYVSLIYNHQFNFILSYDAGSDRGLTLGCYVPNRSIQGDASKLENWKHQQESFSEISNIFGKRFCNLAPTLFRQTMLKVMETQVPTLAEIEFDILHSKDDAFCSNLTYTVEDFSNCFHKDRDYNSYSFGIWAPTCSKTSKLVSRKNGFDSTGGEFLLGSYKVCVDINACDGVLEMIWCGKDDFHSTIQSTTSPLYTRVGTFVQVSNTLVQRMRSLLKQHAGGVDISKKVRGVNNIVEKKLKGLQ